MVKWVSVWLYIELKLRFQILSIYNSNCIPNIPSLREAARHCRVKKKEYLKCLEERVQILEGQNKKLIDELKALKEFYTQHKNDYPDHKHNIWR